MIIAFIFYLPFIAYRLGEHHNNLLDVNVLIIIYRTLTQEVQNGIQETKKMQQTQEIR